MKIYAINNVQVNRLNKSKKNVQLQNSTNSTNQDGENNVNFKGWGNAAKKSLFWGTLAAIATGPVGAAVVTGTLMAKEIYDNDKKKKKKTRDGV